MAEKNNFLLNLVRTLFVNRDITQQGNGTHSNHDSCCKDLTVRSKYNGIRRRWNAEKKWNVQTLPFALYSADESHQEETIRCW